jgi:molybdopterin-guanine dinucleotide biosynthesis protein A
MKPMKYNIPLIIFAGGKSSRMGQDKALLPFGEYKTLSEFQHERLSKLFKKVYISAKENKFDFDVNVIEDRHKESSPLVGIISVFETLKVDTIFILSVDAPFVNREVIDKLIHSNNRFDAVIAKSKSGIQPLCGVYKRSVLPMAQENLKEGNHRLRSLLKKVDTQFVPFPEDALFTNLNHPHEYEEARSIATSL